MILQIILLATFMLVLLYLILIAIDDSLITRTYLLKTKKFKENQKLKLVLLADTHSFGFGLNYQDLLEKVIPLEPDLIILGGDIFDDKKPLESTDKFLDELQKLAPVYYVSGNHEKIAPDYPQMVELLKKNNIIVIEDNIIIEKYNILLCGLDDPRSLDKEKKSRETNLKSAKESKLYKIFLIHRPELAKEFLDLDFDLILSGHTHGGQIIIPRLANGVFIHGQGVFPKLAGGLYEFDNTTHIISRGLANTVYFPRIFNPLEIVYLEIEGE